MRYYGKNTATTWCERFVLTALRCIGSVILVIAIILAILAVAVVANAYKLCAGALCRNVSDNWSKDGHKKN